MFVARATGTTRSEAQADGRLTDRKVCENPGRTKVRPELQTGVTARLDRKGESWTGTQTGVKTRMDPEGRKLDRNPERV